MPAFLILLVNVLVYIRSVYPEAVQLVTAISSLLQKQAPEHAQRIEEILPTKAPGGEELAAELQADMKQASG